MKEHMERLVFICGAVVLMLACSANAKPTLGFSLPDSFQNFPSFRSITKSIIDKRSATQMKTYSGQRFSNDSLIMIYYHDSTIAVTELAPQKRLLNCELIEIYTEKEGKALLENLSKYNRPLEISLEQMFKLMKQCELVDIQNYEEQKNSRDLEDEDDDSASSNSQETLFKKNPISILSGILPGTKWCGTGDIASTYHDLGQESNVDRCCRLHDLCPVKLRAQQSRYGLMNDSVYTKSHCVCDDMLFTCLQKANTPSAQFMGNIYFNLVKIPCLEGTGEKIRYRSARNGF